MAFAQTLRIFRKTMLAILRIWLCLFCENFSIVTKTLILGYPLRSLSCINVNYKNSGLYVKKNKTSLKISLIYLGFAEKKIV